MSVYLYEGGAQLVRKSGVGQAIVHQKQALQLAGIPLSKTMRDAKIVHINTVFPDSLIVAFRAKLRRKKVVYYAHSTKEDFRCSFCGSDLLAPLFQKWIKFCYRRGDVIVTPTEYSKRLLLGYGIRKPVYALSNGVDTLFFAPSLERRDAFRARYGLRDTDKVVISAGHTMERKGIFDFIALATAMPEVRFFWFGHTPTYLIPKAVRDAMASAPENLVFCGYVTQAELRDAYCGADVFAFLSQEETEGIVVLEALACGIPILLRDIPVYDGWLMDGVQVCKAHDPGEFRQKLTEMLAGSSRALSAAGRAVAQSRSLSAVGQQLLHLYQEVLFSAQCTERPADGFRPLRERKRRSL